MPNDTLDKEGFYDFLTLELGWTPQEAFEEITTADEEPGARDRGAEPESITEEAPAPPPMTEGEKMQTALAATDAMRAEEEMLPTDLPSAASQEGDMAQTLWRAEGRPQVTPEMASGFSVTPEQQGDLMPTSKGFMYVGRPVEAPAGYVSPQDQAYDRGVASGLIRRPEPGLSPTSIYRTPEYETFAAQDRYNTMFQATGDARKAMEAAGPALLRTTTGKGGSALGRFFPQPMSDWQQRNAILQQERLDLQKQKQAIPQYAVSERNSLIRQRGAYQIAIAQSQDVVQRAEYIKELKKVNDQIAEWDATFGTEPGATASDMTSTVAPRVVRPPAGVTVTKTAKAKPKLTLAQAQEYLIAAKKDKALARRLAIADGYDTSTQ